jgi:F-type H+-transporting ATPase subunit epsilon
MKLTIITPDKAVFDGEVSSVTVPGSAGSFEVLENHAPIVSTLEDGKVIIRTGKDQKILHIVGGVVEVLDNKITLLAEGLVDQ